MKKIIFICLLSLNFAYAAEERPVLLKEGDQFFLANSGDKKLFYVNPIVIDPSTFMPDPYGGKMSKEEAEHSKLEIDNSEKITAIKKEYLKQVQEAAKLNDVEEAYKEFPKGLLRPELFIGMVSSISAQVVRINLSEAGNPSGSHISGGRYGRGEVGEFVLIEGQQNLLFGRITEVRLPEKERHSIKSDYSGADDLDAIGQIHTICR